MTGLDTIVGLRSRGVKPRAVHVYLVVALDPGQPALSRSGSVTCEVALHESLSDLDLRPLHGLYVLTHDLTGNRERHRRLARLVAEQDPAQLCTFDGSTLYRRIAGETPTTEAVAL